VVVSFAVNAAVAASGAAAPAAAAADDQGRVLYTAVLPAAQFKAGDLVRWRVQVRAAIRFSNKFISRGLFEAAGRL
jgi:hypothetical protein